MDKYSVYILRSDIDGSFYIGVTSDIARRVDMHNSGLGRYTRHKIPWKLVYSEEFSTKPDALKREKFLKAQRNRDFYNRLIALKN
jgi:putative endonuclease